MAIISLVAMTLLFIDVTGYAAAHWSWMAKWQLVPALLAVNLLVVLVLIALTLLLGRVYCSVICPLGIYQDVVNRISIWFSPRNKRRLGRFRYHKAYKSLRLGFLGVFVILVVLALAGVVGQWCASLIEPYSAFGRIMTWLGRPVGVEINNALADMAEANGSYAFVRVQGLSFVLPLFIVAAVTLVVVTLFAWRGGRQWCNTVCPVGTTLGFLSRYAWLRPVINTDRCTRCGSCGRHCKASCIDTKKHQIDYSRCVSCMDCLTVCREGAITFSHPKKDKKAVNQATSKPSVDSRRRAFLVGGTIVASALASKAVTSATDGGLAPLKKKQPSLRTTPIVPPGAVSARHLASHCVACQLCISACPNGVIKPSTDFKTFMQPVLDFTDGYCRPECNRCSEVCPAGAIKPIDLPVKVSTKIGTAIVDLDQCISAAYGQHCGNCARRCPIGAITMIPVSEGASKMRPLVNSEACIGCGSCEYHCPVGKTASIRATRAAIYVDGIAVHRLL